MLDVVSQGRLVTRGLFSSHEALELANRGGGVPITGKSSMGCQQVNVVYDLGFFLYFAWPFIVPYYLFKTRGIRAILTILVFVGIYLATYLVGLLVFFIIVSMSS